MCQTSKMVSNTVFSTVLVCCLVYTASARFRDDGSNTVEDSGSVSTSRGVNTGDKQISVKGSVSWQQTITVKQQSEAETPRPGGHHEHRHHPHFFNMCCMVGTNQTDNPKLFKSLMKCRDEVIGLFSNNGTIKTPRPSNHLKAANCFFQCVGKEMELIEESGSIKTKETVDFVATDYPVMELGITKEQIEACVITSKRSTPDPIPAEGGKVCNLLNFEAARFTKCLMDLKNLNCPAEKRIHTPVCDRMREQWQRK